jgi:hypothetical protein
MYGLAEYEVLEQRHDEIRGRVEDRETGSYVVRDLSWEFTRYLDTEEYSTGASVTSNGAS